MAVEAATREAVLDAFRRARKAGYDSPDCYRAATSAWCKAHPANSPSLAARRAAEVVNEWLSLGHDAVDE